LLLLGLNTISGVKKQWEGSSYLSFLKSLM
ncbi:unnamed protein product, partial [marine sediment metagenome]